MTIVNGTISVVDVNNLKNQIQKQEKICNEMFDKLKDKNKTTDIITVKCRNCGSTLKVSYNDIHSGRLCGYEVFCPICGEKIDVNGDPWVLLGQYVRELDEYKEEAVKLELLKNDLQGLYRLGRELA